MNPFPTKHRLLTHSHMLMDNIYGPDLPPKPKPKYEFVRKTEPEQQIYNGEAAWWLGPLTSKNVYEKKRFIDCVPCMKKKGILPKERRAEAAIEYPGVVHPEALRKSPPPPTKRKPHMLAPRGGWTEAEVGRLPSPVNWQEPLSPRTPSTKNFPAGKMYESTPVASNAAMKKLAGREVYSLKEDTFKDFLGDKDVALVMFYKELGPEFNKTEQEFIKATKMTSREGAVFATVNCARNFGLCWDEEIFQTPAFKLFSRGQAIVFFRDVKDLNAKSLSEYVNRTPISSNVNKPAPFTPYDKVLDRGFLQETSISKDSDQNESLDQTLDSSQSKCKRRWGLIGKCIGR